MNYDEILENFSKERIFSRINGKNKIIESLANKLEHVDLITIYSFEARIVTIEYNNEFVIIWDESYWKHFKEYLILQKYVQKINSNFLEANISVMARFLSEKYVKFKKISRFIHQINMECNIRPNLEVTEIDEINIQLLIAKVYVFFHEVGHIRIAQKDESIKATKNIIIRMLKNIKKIYFSDLGEWSELAYNTVQELLQGFHQEIMEELIADIFAIGKLSVYLEDLYGENFNINSIKHTVISICRLSCYQNLFNIVNKVWDLYYAEIRFNLKPCKKEIDHKINELEIVRNGIGNILSVTLLLSYFELDEQTRKEIWKLYDNAHVKNGDAINIMTSHDFICKLIEEAMQ